MRPCSVCGAVDREVTTYGLRTQVRENGKPHSSGAGSIRLCSPCWTRIAAPTMRSPK